MIANKWCEMSVVGIFFFIMSELESQFATPTQPNLQVLILEGLSIAQSAAMAEIHRTLPIKYGGNSQDAGDDKFILK